ncbi:fumarylacetoacetase [Geosmithia morbida]|uniref:Fumarylacetoacetase n=1 Tax=Geosmithia morbida TaxID=1094350 RepID=A0A9P5D116_9HYPO|nr:fumarylacetoacetase [Geosmithia morbida]KAF4119420.1 fumarylacetoacetase [Geosmithia morbida]
MSWVPIAAESPFSLANIPFGIISTDADSTCRPAIAIGDHALDLKAFSNGGGFSQSPEIEKHAAVFSRSTLNEFAALGRPFHRLTRTYLLDILRSDTQYPALLRDNPKLKTVAMVAFSDLRNHMPMAVGDYTDFYASTNHAYNVGVLFRGPSNALQPNYKHLPVAYHGRASSVVVSGTSIRRPWGQTLRDPKAEIKEPILGPCQKMDIELEMGMFLCRPNDLGNPVHVDKAEEHIFGYVLMNDWSARDLQAWEYVPLGPFTSKNMGTSISPWVVLADAAIPRTHGLTNENTLLPYLKESSKETVLDVTLEVDLIAKSGSRKTIVRTNSNNILWSWPQMIAHHTISGCNLQPGDLFGSGTISGLEPGSEGSLLEQTQGGKVPIKFGKEERIFLNDGDTVVMRGWAGKDGARIGFGEVSGTIEAPLPSPY